METEKALIGICGSGAMGAGIAQVAALAGRQVVVYDVAAASLDRGRTLLEAGLASLVKRGTIREPEARETLGRVRFTTDLDDLAASALAIEAIVEDPAVKTALFARLEAVLGPAAIIASNTSSLSIGALAAGLQRPGRFAGMHFFNPAAVMKLVEVVAGPLTTPETTAAVTEMATAWRKQAVLVRDVPGFIVNRVARPYYAEGLRAWAEGVSTPSGIDHAFRCAGFRMGPLELADLIGHDVNFAVARSVYDAYFGRTRFAPQAAQAALVASGRLGRKTGRGVYEGAAPEPDFVRAGPAEATASKATLSAMIEGGRARLGAVSFQLGDGRSAAQAAAQIGGPVALLDWTRDPAAAETLVFTASDPEATEAAAALGAALGKETLVLKDRPGGLVLRTLAQVANAGADAVRDQVAAADGIDRALVYGANYPFGPLAWARAAGFETVVQALDRIATETGEEMYRPSETLRRAAWTGELA